MTAPHPHESDAPRPGAWMVAEGPRRTWARFRRDWAALPAGCARAWVRVLAIGLVICGGVVLAVVAWARRMAESGALAWEADWLRAFADAGPSFANAIWMDSPGNSVIMIPLVLLAAAAAVWIGRPLRALTILVCFFGIDVLVNLGWWTWDRARPDVIAGGVAAPGLHSFPSGHLAQTTAAYGFLVWLWMRCAPAWGERALAVLVLIGVMLMVATARLRLGAHWPSDVVAGTLIGAAWLGVCIAALRRAEAAGGR